MDSCQAHQGKNPISKTEMHIRHLIHEFKNGVRGTKILNILKGYPPNLARKKSKKDKLISDR